MALFKVDMQIMMNRCSDSHPSPDTQPLDHWTVSGIGFDLNPGPLTSVASARAEHTSG